jgi:hypothetical protein
MERLAGLVVFVLFVTSPYGAAILCVGASDLRAIITPALSTDDFRRESDKEIYSVIKQAEGNSSTLFTYEKIQENGRIGVLVDLGSVVINVNGFRFRVFNDENVNSVVSSHVRPK